MNSRLTRGRFRLGKADYVFAAFMAVMFALLAVNRLTGGALDTAFQTWRSAL